MTMRDDLIDTIYDGRYRVLRRIGVGGMANVYLAEDTTLGRNVAIKVLNRRFSEDEPFVERFMREASAAARLNHPNIVQVYDRGECDGTYYIAMEFVDGLTLKDIIKRRGSLSEAEVLAYSRQALNALRFAHRHGIVHRDIKPHNMMVDGEGRLKIADFGIARAGADQGLTEAGSIVGTAQYLSPEQARGENVTAASDLYSMGVVMYEMACGKVPFDGDTSVTIALQHVNDPVPRPATVNPQVSPALEAVIMRALQKNPDLRFQTADDLLADLDAARRGEVGSDTAAITRVVDRGATTVVAGMPAQGPARTSTMQPPPPRQPASTPVTPAGLSSFASSPLDDDRRRPARRQRRAWPWVLLALVIAGVAAAGAWAYLSATSGVAVPDVVGLKQAAAEREIEQAEFVVGDVSKEFSEKDKGTVIDQDPGGGDTAKKGSVVDLVVSKGPAPVEVPSLVGKTRPQAEQLLRELGLKARITRAYDDTVKPGVVISQNPEPGTELQTGTAVTITVSKGVEEVEVPSVVGLTADQARSTLEQAGLSVTIEKTHDGTEPEDEVIDQQPAAGSSVEKDTQVTLVVATGYNTVPDVATMSEEEATATLQENGFEVEVAEVEDATLPAGTEPTVTEQVPAASQRKPVGTTVKITITKPPPGP